ncbi:unnamed protein product [Calypogeia fissa]
MERRHFTWLIAESGRWRMNGNRREAWTENGGDLEDRQKKGIGAAGRRKIGNIPVHFESASTREILYTRHCVLSSASMVIAPSMFVNSRLPLPRPELAKVDFAPPLRTIVLNGESDFSQELTTLKALIGNVHVEAYDSGLRRIPATIRGVYEEVESPDQSSLALSRRPQRQYKGLRSNYCSNDSKSSFWKGKQQQQRRLSSSCGKRVGFGSILAATAALGIVVVSLAMGSCQYCYRSNQYQEVNLPGVCPICECRVNKQSS